jgi:tRNA U34 2-thiouridine synthase MnmA/TrmU
VRYRSTPVRCRVSFLEESSEVSFNGLPVGLRLHVELLDPVSSVTPGQSAVFFPPLEKTPSDWVMMGGIIALH